MMCYLVEIHRMPYVLRRVHFEHYKRFENGIVCNESGIRYFGGVAVS